MPNRNKVKVDNKAPEMDYIQTIGKFNKKVICRHPDTKEEFHVPIEATDLASAEQKEQYQNL